MRGWVAARRTAQRLCALLVLGATVVTPAHAFDIELTDVAADRVERQRAYVRGATPLPGTPDLSRLEERLSAKGLAKGNPIFIRVFKETSELELWMQRDSDRKFVLLDTYPICHWTGTLGPKMREGDRQSPEGFYTVRWQQTRLVGRWQKAFNLGFPNPYDQLNRRTGSYILVHGGCSSVGCYAMTEQVQNEIFSLATAAIAKGQHRFHVHAFPFRMTDENMARHADHQWIDFWRDLKHGHDLFEATRQPPRVAICEQRYQVSAGEPEDAGNPAAFAMLRPPATKIALEGSYQPPRCEMDGDRTRTARHTPSAGEPDSLPRSAPAPSEPQDDNAAPKPVRKAQQPRPSALPALKDHEDGGLGARPHPGAPRIVSGGG